jgi:hypothetical protein
MAQDGEPESDTDVVSQKYGEQVGVFLRHYRESGNPVFYCYFLDSGSLPAFCGVSQCHSEPQAKNLVFVTA